MTTGRSKLLLGLLLASAAGSALALAACANDRPARAEPAPGGPAALDAQSPGAAPIAPPPVALAPPPEPERPAVPKGCDINLGGRYKLWKKPFWTYLLEDDGVHVIAKRVDLPDAGAPSPPGASEASGLVLDRTARGFLGHELGFARSPSGTRCPVTFRAEIVSCDAQGVTLRSEDTVALDDQCRIQRPAAGAGSTTEKVLVRQ